MTPYTQQALLSLGYLHSSHREVGSMFLTLLGWLGTVMLCDFGDKDIKGDLASLVLSRHLSLQL